MSSAQMKRMRWLALLLLSGCAWAGAPSRPPLPYASWYLGFFSPPHMEAWTEAAEVEDIDGRLFANLESGTVSISDSGNAAGWPARPGWGKGRDVTGANLPKRIAVRWQSLAEPQTYRVILTIPESARQQMLTKSQSTAFSGEYDYQYALSIGLAPGGWVRAWVMSPGGLPVEILCTRAEIEPKGPSQGLTNGNYAYSVVQLDGANQQYLKTHPIPYDSWACPGVVLAPDQRRP